MAGLSEERRLGRFFFADVAKVANAADLGSVWELSLAGSRPAIRIAKQKPLILFRDFSGFLALETESSSQDFKRKRG